MGRYIRWQAILTLTGIAMTMAFLGFLSLSRQTVTIPDVGGVYTEAIAGEPRFINPLLAQFNQVDQDLTTLIFNGLTRIDGDGNPQPDLAKSWQISDDGLTYTFKLRKDIKWQDGEPFSADDVLFTIGLMQDPEFPGAPHLGSLWRSVTAEKLDAYTVQFVLPEALPGFMQFTNIGMLPKHILAQMPARDLLNHPFNLQPVGTGPFKLDEVNAAFARLSPNPLYAGPKPKLGGLEFRFYADFPAMLAAYKNGEVQGIGQIPPQAIPEVREIDSLNLFTGRLSGYNIIYLNLQDAENSPFFQEAAVRRALLHAIDRQKLIEETLNGQGLPAVGPILPWSWAFNPEQETPAFDPALAAQLLNEAGWTDSDADGVRDKDGVPLAFSLLSSEEPAKIDVALAVARQWQQLGISATVDVVGAGMGQRLSSHNFQAALAEVLLAGDPDPYPFWHQTQIENGQNYAGWDNTEASKLLETARTLTDRGQRSDAYFEFQRIFAEEVPSLVLFHPVYTYGVSKDVFDVQIAPLIKPGDRFETVTNWYMLTRQIIFREVGQSLWDDNENENGCRMW
ncbi:MAG: peptide ABC transporter substrate-binding protein [Chloroflexi bacterium]|nr:MAG: peptide ABC transporter substrate-binding protein [Chloroflexota bacterium]